MSHSWPVGPDPLETTSESDQASLSPRTTLLSPPFEENVATRIPRGPGTKFRHERERAHSTATPHALLHMLVSEEYESKQTRKILYTAFDRLEQETRRAETAEARIEETVQRARAINDARVAAQQQAVRAQEELKLYKLQLDNAQKEILRAQDVLKAIEAQRDEAETAAAAARSKARRLNEERLIELAREEGRRLGFEEGVRRGRRIGYREAYSTGIDDERDDVREVATVVVNRLLEDPREPGRIEAPSTSRSAHEGRPQAPVDSSLENQQHGSRGRHDSVRTINKSTSTLRRTPDPPAVVDPRVIPPVTASTPSRPSQSRSGPLADAQFGRPIPIQHSPPSVRHSEFHVPPDNYIPAAGANQNISLPPPHGMQRSIPSPTPSQRALGQTSSRVYMYDNYSHPRRASPDQSSLASTKQSASTISQLDIISLPANHRRPPNLSVIHEDVSIRSERMTDYSQTASEAGGSPSREMASTETLRRDRKSKQQLADELRYSDPSTPEQWRRQSESSRSHDAPPRHRPSHVTVPTPLSPPRVLQQPESRHRWADSERQGRPDTRSEYRDERRPLSSDSSVPEINVEPPSGPPSDAPSRGNVPTRGLLSPDHANLPLPIPEPPAPNGRNLPGPSSPVARQVNLAEQFYAGPRDHAPVIPQSTSGRYSVPFVPPPPSSERETGRSRSPISFYAASPVPTGVTYPAPPVSRSAANPYFPGSASNPSVTSDGRRRHDSLSATAGMTPANRTKPVSSAASSTDGGGGDGRRRSSHRRSSGSLASQQSQSRPSYSRYDPNVYNDPAFLASSDSFVDSVTDANTAANGGGPVRPVRIRGSPAYSYATLRTND